jgi:hypothetical protein
MLVVRTSHVPARIIASSCGGVSMVPCSIEWMPEALLAAAPVPDPRAMRQRRADREDLLAAHEPTG